MERTNFNRRLSKLHLVPLTTSNLIHENVLVATRIRSLGQGHVFTPVCDSVHGEGVSAPLHAGIHTPLGRHPQTDSPPGQTPAKGETLQADTHPPDTTRYGQQAGSMHPTGMHTCYKWYSF